MKQLSLRTCKKSLLTSKWTLCSSTFQDGGQSDTLIFQRWKGIPQPRSPPRSGWRNHHESAAVPWSRAGHTPLNHGPLRGPYEAPTRPLPSPLPHFEFSRCSKMNNAYVVYGTACVYKELYGSAYRILVPRAYDPSGLRQESIPAAGQKDRRLWGREFKNRWLAEEFLPGRVRTTLTADLLLGLEELGKILGK